MPTSGVPPAGVTIGTGAIVRGVPLLPPPQAASAVSVRIASGRERSLNFIAYTPILKWEERRANRRRIVLEFAWP